MVLKWIVIVMGKNSVWKRSRLCIRISKILKESSKLQAERSCRVMMKMIMKMKQKDNFLRFIGKNVDFYIRFSMPKI